MHRARSAELATARDIERLRARRATAQPRTVRAIVFAVLAPRGKTAHLQRWSVLAGEHPVRIPTGRVYEAWL